MQTVQAILILVSFLAAVGLMMTKKLPAIVAMPVLGILIAAIAGVPFLTPAEEGGQTIFGHVIGTGSARLGSTIVVTIFGAIFAKVIEKQGIAGEIIRKAAELAGDKPRAVAFAISLAIFLIFIGMSGTGAVIMVATIAIPLLLAAGIAPIAAASLILMSLTAGLMINVSAYQMYIDMFGMTADDAKYMGVVLAVIGMVITFVYIMLKVKPNPVRSSWAMPAQNQEKKVHPVALVMPVLPLVLVFLFKLDALPALMIGIVVTALITTPKDIANVLSACFIEGIKDVAAAIGLMIGIGILLNGVTTTAVTTIIQPYITAITPKNAIVYVILFTVLSPLATYRGPLNSGGMGGALGTLMIGTGLISPNAIGWALRANTFTQCICDPTNTHNVVCADFAHVDVNDVLKSTLPYAVVMCFIGMVYAGIFIY